MESPWLLRLIFTPMGKALGVVQTVLNLNDYASHIVRHEAMIQDLRERLCREGIPDLPLKRVK